MKAQTNVNIFNKIHIDVARNATDDFNLFHDSKKWWQIQNNPFEGPIVLGFELESLIEDKIRLYRQTHNEDLIINEKQLRFSNYQLNFVKAVKPGEAIVVDIKPTQNQDQPENILSNRVCVKVNGKLAMMGYKKETNLPLYLPDPKLPDFITVRNQPDRSYIASQGNHGQNAYFIKRKFMNISNAKNFLCGSLVDQTEYFDELENKARFPEVFPCGLISCALLEKGFKENHNFKKNPMVYTSHKISVDRTHLAKLKSNDMLHILVKQLPPQNKEGDKVITYECYGLVNENNILYRGLISLTALENILKAK